jgi:hypothetical protein
VGWLVEANISEKHAFFMFSPEDGDSTFLQNAGFYQPAHKVT